MLSLLFSPSRQNGEHKELLQERHPAKMGTLTVYGEYPFPRFVQSEPSFPRIRLKSGPIAVIFRFAAYSSDQQNSSAGN